MSPSDLVRELIYPLTNLTLLIAMLVFFLLGKLASAAGLLGIWLFVVIMPAYFRYLMSVLAARMSDREPEPPGIEMFNWIAGAWTLMPLLVLVGIGWLTLELADYVGPLAAVPAAILLLLAYPASMAILAMTHSAIGSINPVAIVTLIRICGPRYLMVPTVITVLTGTVYFFGAAGLPRPAVEFAEVYLFFLLFSLTGAVVGKSDVQKYLENPDPVGPEEDVVESLAEKQRVKVLDHAYGLVSRGNRAGGFAHIKAHLDRSASVTDDFRWFFEEMLCWEDSDPALFFAQRYLHHLLEVDEHVQALKLLSRCLLANPRFRPLPEDRGRAIELAETYEREDLIKHLS